MDNAQVARGVFEELFSRGRLDFVDQNFDRSYRGHDTLMRDFDINQAKKNVQMYRAAFPDLTITVDDLVAATDKVLVRWTARGTHRGEFLGKAPTGKKSQVQGITVLSFRNGKIAEDFTQWDALGLLRDLGISAEATPKAPQATA